MSFITQNELEHFQFEEAVAEEFRPSPGGFTLLLDNVRILPENSTNRDIRTMRCNEMSLKIEEGKILGLYEEGYKVYDADCRLIEELPERKIPEEELEEALKNLCGCELDDLTSEDGLYRIFLRGEGHTFRLELSGSGDRESWEKYLNL